MHGGKLNLEMNSQEHSTSLLEIPLDQGTFAYMDLGCIGFNESVVVVDRHRFLPAWRNTRTECHKSVANGSPLNWPDDYKYREFIATEGYPLQLPKVHASYTDKMPWIDFSGGITRTIWLLTKGAPYLALSCSAGNTETLQEICGIRKEAERSWTLLLG